MIKTTVVAVLLGLLFTLCLSAYGEKTSWVAMETHSITKQEMKVPKEWIPLEKLHKDDSLMQNVLFKAYSHAIKVPYHATHLVNRTKGFMNELHNTLQLLAQDHYYESEEYHERLVNVSIALKQRNIHVLQKRFEKVTNPKDPEWTNYWSMKFVGKLTKPSTFSNETVMAWLSQYREHGLEITNITAHGDYVNVRAPVRVLNEMLNTVMIPFVHKEAPHRHGIIFRAHNAKYHVPSHVAPHIDFVNNVVQFPQIRKAAVLKAEGRPHTQIVPAFILQQYNATRYVPTSVSKANRQAVVQLLYQYYSPDDLNAFFQNFVNGANPAPVRTVGDQNDPTNPGDEATLDIEYIMGVGQNIKTDFIVSAAEDPFVDWIQILQQQGDDSGFVQSVSYGGNEAGFTKNYVTRMNNEVMKIGITGRTVLYASGDSGVTCSDDGSSFMPDFPGTLPYITTVGATQPVEDGNGRALPQEKASETFPSGGGFSNFFPVADYQAEVVKGYLSSMRSRGQLPPTSYFNVSGRAYPDIAAYGVSYTIVLNGEAGLVDGTSASTPAFGALVSLMNEERLKRGMKPLGFLNNWLYSVVYKTPGALRDVTIGNNANDPCPGFKATQGWDPVTGLGTPNLGVLMNLALQKNN